MTAESPIIVFIDNSLNRIYKTLETLKIVYKDIKVFNSEEQALEFIRSNHTDLLLLNLDLLPNDAVTFTKEILQKKTDSYPFIVIYSDKQDDFVQEMAFNAGIDSFINFQNKPAVLELFIRNLLARREKMTATDQKMISIDRERYLVYKKEVPVQLPRKEFKIFELIYGTPQKFFSKEEIALEIWEDINIAKKRIIDVHIYNIRQFLGRNVIQSLKGKGYRINSKFI